jgi:hypothetical protein
MGLIERRLEQAEAVDGGALDGGEVGVIGLVAGVGRQAELLGGQRMDDAGLAPGGDGGALDRGVVVAGSLDGDDEVAEVVLGQGAADGGGEFAEAVPRMLERGG